MENTTLKHVPISLETIANFEKYLKDKERSEATIRKYCADLRAFYNFLPKTKRVTSVSLPKWRDSLLEANLSARTINTRIAACNSFLSFLDRAQWQIPPLPFEIEEIAPAITREEYCLLLKTAHESDKEWLYFLVKTFCCLGLSVSELPFLTVDALVSGKVKVVTKTRSRNIYIPKVLQTEFLHYAMRCKINSGSLFKSPEGQPLTRSFVLGQIQELCKAAGIPDIKANPKSMRELYYHTYSHIRSLSSALIENEYSKILEAEDQLVGWNSLTG